MAEVKFIERHIVTGLITSTAYLREVRGGWDERLLQSPTARRLASWCLEYYDRYNRAPNQDIEGIYVQKLKAGLPPDMAEEIEEDILPDLSEEYERGNFNLEYLLDRTREYFTERNLALHLEQIESLREEGDLKAAEELANQYRPLQTNLAEDLYLSNPDSLLRVEKAFTTQTEPLLMYPGALGRFWNRQMTRDALVAFVAPEKRGKSYLLLDVARRAVRQRLTVAFFQAGDMSEAQQIRRLAIHLAKKSDLEEYCGVMYEPVKDCIRNQLDLCDGNLRECDFGLTGEGAPKDAEDARTGMTMERLLELYRNPDNRGYRPCHNCSMYAQRPTGSVWLKKVRVRRPLEAPEAVKLIQQYFVENQRKLIISTHANNTLTVARIKNKLDEWYRLGFIPDVIIIDYADLLVASGRYKEYRHQQNEIWQDLRNLSQERHALVVTATQADAKSYETSLLKLSNFSEDKRKYAHVTAMYGLNRDPQGREEKIGILRINEMVLREGQKQGVVTVLQNLRRGQPVITSFW